MKLTMKNLLLGLGSIGVVAAPVVAVVACTDDEPTPVAPGQVNDLTGAGDSVWHGFFHQGGRSLPKEGTVLGVSVNGKKYQFTWEAGDAAAKTPAAFLAGTAGQPAMLAYLAGRFATAGIQASDAYAAFGVKMHGAGTFTAADMTGAPATAATEQTNGASKAQIDAVKANISSAKDAGVSAINAAATSSAVDAAAATATANIDKAIVAPVLATDVKSDVDAAKSAITTAASARKAALGVVVSPKEVTIQKLDGHGGSMTFWHPYFANASGAGEGSHVAPAEGEKWILGSLHATWTKAELDALKNVNDATEAFKQIVARFVKDNSGQTEAQIQTALGLYDTASHGGGTFLTAVVAQTTQQAAKFDFTTDLAKFVDASSTLDTAAVAALSGAKTAAELGYTTPTLSTDVTATYTIASGTVTVTLHKGTEVSATKTFTLTGATAQVAAPAIVLTGSSIQKDSWHHMFTTGATPHSGDGNQVILKAGQTLELTIGQDKIDYVLKDADITAMNDFLKATPLTSASTNGPVHQKFIELVANMIKGTHSLEDAMKAMGFSATADHHHVVLPVATQAPAGKTFALDATDATWHALFHVAGAHAFIGKENDVLEITLPSGKLSHTLSAADVTAITTAFGTAADAGQNEAVNAIVAMFVAQDGSKSAEIKTYFGTIATAITGGQMHSVTIA